MGTNPAAQRQISRAVERGASVVVALHWLDGSKSWRIVASLHSGKSVRVVTEDVAWSGAPDLEELRRLVGAIRRECESWLW